MGQACSCCAGVLVNKSRRRHTRHKRFDFAPKRSWKYKDATLLNEFHEMEMSHDINNHSDTEQLINDNGAAATPTSVAVGNSNHQQQADLSSDEEEIDTGNYRPSGRLMFTEDDSDEEMMATSSSKSGYSHLLPDDEENRDRSQSTGSEQIGRFEVWDVVDEGGEPSSPTSQPQLPFNESNHDTPGDNPSTTTQEKSSQLMANPQS